MMTNDIAKAPMAAPPESVVPDHELLKKQHANANLLVDDIVLKNYLSKLTDLDVIPLGDDLKKIDAIRVFKITKMVYQTDEYSTYKFASVFNSVQHLDCVVFVIVNSDGEKTDFYMGVRSFDPKRTVSSLINTLSNALRGQFPGVEIDDLHVECENDENKKSFGTKKLIEDIANKSKNISAVSCVAQNKDEEFTDDKRFLQGLEKFALAMQERSYTAVVLAKSMSASQLAATRSAYETIYTHLSPFAEMQVSYGENESLSISDTFTKGTSRSTGISTSESKPDNCIKGIVAAAKAVAGVLTGGASIAADVAISASVIPDKNKLKTNSVTESTNESLAKTFGKNTGKSENMQLTIRNKSLINTLERIDLQLKRIEECESLGMWGCAAYFLADMPETAEMAAGTYKALMKGEKSGVETSTINSWYYKDENENENENVPALLEYITNFIHPEFEYKSLLEETSPMTAASLVSGNELAILMGLPRKSVCGFPVIEHANFGKEALKITGNESIELGKIFSMGEPKNTVVSLDCKSLTMHTFITGSTGSGKSNTVYKMLSELRKKRKHFLVIEPAKGEYKDVFKDAAVYGTDPNKTKLLKINPFSFLPDVHVLTHMGRLLELFNVCWSMYDAMSAILKKAMERAYEEAGWDLEKSKPPKDGMFPNFMDLLEQIRNIVNKSAYSDEIKGNYIGALCERISSLTDGVYAHIFSDVGLSDSELFDNNAIIDLSNEDNEARSLIMGLLIMKLNEYRRFIDKKPNNDLSHITVLEEAHNLLRRTSTEQSSEGSNLIGKSVESLANAIAEMRTYGEGFIIADQSPGLLDMSVIRNTNTKIILRLPERGDRELVGFSAGLNEKQVTELSKLEVGVAAVYQNNWVEPVLVKINEYTLEEEKSGIEKEEPSNVSIEEGKSGIEKEEPSNVSIKEIRKQIVLYLWIKSKCWKDMESEIKHLNIDIAGIRDNMSALGLSARNRKLLKELIESLDKIEWTPELSCLVVDILDVRKDIRGRVENCVESWVRNKGERKVDYYELNRELIPIVENCGFKASDQITSFVIYCLMVDWYMNKRGFISKEIFFEWYKFFTSRLIKEVDTYKGEKINGH